MKSQKLFLRQLCLLLAISCLARSGAAQDEAQDKAQANLSVGITASTNTPTGNRPISLDVKVTNQGPQTATDVFVHAEWESTSWFESATPLAGGKCFPLRRGYGNEGNCILDKLDAGQSATFRFNLMLRENFGTRFPPEGRDVQVIASTNSRSLDINPDDNMTWLNLNVKPDLNEPPEVKITSPVSSKPLANTSTLTITAMAHDPDGVVSEIECYSRKDLIGKGIPEGENLYRVELADVVPGENYVEVCATDNGGRTTCDSASFSG